MWSMTNVSSLVEAKANETGRKQNSLSMFVHVQNYCCFFIVYIFIYLFLHHCYRRGDVFCHLCFFLVLLYKFDSNKCETMMVVRGSIKQTNYRKHTLCNKGVDIWIKLTPEIQTIDSLSKFKRNVKLLYLC